MFRKSILVMISIGRGDLSPRLFILTCFLCSFSALRSSQPLITATRPGRRPTAKARRGTRRRRPLDNQCTAPGRSTATVVTPRTTTMTTTTIIRPVHRRVAHAKTRRRKRVLRRTRRPWRMKTRQWRYRWERTQRWPTGRPSEIKTRMISPRMGVIVLFSSTSKLLSAFLEEVKASRTSPPRHLFCLEGVHMTRYKTWVWLILQLVPRIKCMFSDNIHECTKIRSKFRVHWSMFNNFAPSKFQLVLSFYSIQY